MQESFDDVTDVEGGIRVLVADQIKAEGSGSIVPLSRNEI